MHFVHLVLLVILLMPAIVSAAGENSDAEKLQADSLKSHVLEPVTVTATKREENIEDVPASISTVSDVEVEEMGAWELSEVTNILPNVHMKNATSGDAIVIRGLSTIDTSIYSPVGLYVNDVPYSLTYMQNLLFMDIERIEVLRGPQGTLYGGNSEAGVVNVVLKKPDNHVRANIFADYGSYDTLRAGGTFSTPLILDRLFFAGNFVRYQTDGFTHNEFKDDDTAGENETLQGRGELRWTPADALDLSLALDAAHVDKGIGVLRYETGVNATDRFEVMSDAADDADEDSVNPSLTVKYSGDAMEAVSISSYRDYHYAFLSDLDRTSSFKGYSDLDLDQGNFTQEFRISSAGGNRLDWLVGLFAGNSDMDVDFKRIRPVSSASTYLDTSATETDCAAFGQATYALFGGLRLTAGLRGEYNVASGDQTYRLGSGKSVSYDKDLHSFELLPMASLSYDIRPNVTAYATWSNGFLAGGYNYFSADSLETFYYEPEHTTNYEIGLKTDWCGKKLLCNVSLYYTDIRDKQVREEDPDGGVGVWKFTNAAGAHSQGVEAELTARPVAGLELQGGIGYAHAVIDDWTVLQDGLPYSYDGKRLPWAPDLTYHFGAGYAHASGLFGRMDLYGGGKQYFDAENTLSQSGFVLVNTRLGYATDHWELAFWGKNIFDVEYATKKVRDTAGDVMVEDGDPQTFGGSLTWRF